MLKLLIANRVCASRQHEPVVKASLHPAAETRNSDLIKDKLYSTKINPQPEEEGAACCKFVHSTLEKKQFYWTPVTEPDVQSLFAFAFERLSLIFLKLKTVQSQWQKSIFSSELCNYTISDHKISTSSPWLQHGLYVCFELSVFCVYAHVEMRLNCQATSGSLRNQINWPRSNHYDHPV